MIHIQYLMDPTTGLWIHGWEFDDEGSGHGFARALWGRGNCWVSMKFGGRRIMDAYWIFVDHTGDPYVP